MAGAYDEYQAAKADYVNFAQQDFGGQLRDSIMKEVNDNKDLIAQVKAGEEGYYNAPSAAREAYQSTFNPFQREALVDKATGIARQGMTVPQELLKQRMGLISDTVAGATAGYEKQAGLKKDLVSMAWDEYQASRKGSGSGSAKKATLASLDEDIAYGVSDIVSKGLQPWATEAFIKNLQKEYPDVAPLDVENAVYKYRKDFENRYTF